MIFIDQREFFLPAFFFCLRVDFGQRGFLQEAIFAGGGFWTEGGFCRRGFLAGGRFWSEGGFGRRVFFLFSLTTTVATPNINCILVSTL